MMSLGQFIKLRGLKTNGSQCYMEVYVSMEMYSMIHVQGKLCGLGHLKDVLIFGRRHQSHSFLYDYGAAVGHEDTESNALMVRHIIPVYPEPVMLDDASCPKQDKKAACRFLQSGKNLPCQRNTTSSDFCFKINSVPKG